MYKQIKIDGVMANIIKRLSDEAWIPMDEQNSDYQQYLAWLEAGNQPEPAEEQ